MQPSRFVRTLLARAVQCTRVVDRGYRLFDRLRSKMVLACASDGFYDVYNDLTYARQYRAGSEAFRSGLFPFEEQVILRHFPLPPQTVLVGAAGGGREAFALARRGYRIVAFDPALPLAESMQQGCGELPIEAYVGRYEDLPVIAPLAQPQVTIDLRSLAPFGAAILGWGSFSHLRCDEHCIETLRQFGQLTAGPVLVSYHPAGNAKTGARYFSASIGYYWTFQGIEFRSLAERAGLAVLEFEETANFPYAVLCTPTKLSDITLPQGTYGTEA